MQYYNHSPDGYFLKRKLRPSIMCTVAVYTSTPKTMWLMALYRFVSFVAYTLMSSFSSLHLFLWLGTPFFFLFSLSLYLFPPGWFNFDGANCVYTNKTATKSTIKYNNTMILVIKNKVADCESHIAKWNCPQKRCISSAINFFLNR